ncbi:hypothetical protein Q4591_11055 [Shewanella sp. 3_MG-2023]|uniref:hypothetical protein n=1 Tax=Shewanella sp. 3_MG-2023 TaxID=3062635 RepID=UPI0026E317DC|nr:hypothetical protein [Shewanella sp. 3_MG-2023]MDO6775899.1 hypothetical protein [Shewanella sp. 3_MG-2023]
MINFKQKSEPKFASGVITGGDDMNPERGHTVANTEIQLGLPANVDVFMADRYGKYEQSSALTDNSNTGQLMT